MYSSQKRKVKAETLTAYEDKVSDEPLISEKPQGGKITKQENGPFGSTILTLSNGVRVILKSTDFKADEIRMRAFSPGGSSLFPNDEIININVMNDVQVSAVWVTSAMLIWRKYWQVKKRV